MAFRKGEINANTLLKMYILEKKAELLCQFSQV